MDWRDWKSVRRRQWLLRMFYRGLLACTVLLVGCGAKRHPTVGTALILVQPESVWIQPPLGHKPTIIPRIDGCKYEAVLLPEGVRIYTFFDHNKRIEGECDYLLTHFLLETSQT